MSALVFLLLAFVGGAAWSITPLDAEGMKAVRGGECDESCRPGSACKSNTGCIKPPGEDPKGCVFIYPVTQVNLNCEHDPNGGLCREWWDYEPPCCIKVYCDHIAPQCKSCDVCYWEDPHDCTDPWKNCKVY